jgi:aspartyl protease family protein
VASARADRLASGSIERDGMRVHVADGEELNVLGMNFLSSLELWGVEGRWLVLQP